MSICSIGGKKKIDGKWYTKRKGRFGDCGKCSLQDGNSCSRNRRVGDTGVSIEDGGPECNGTIWVACGHAAQKRHTAKWNPIPTGTKLTKAALVEMANKFGAENAKLKNKLAKGGEG